MKKITIFTMQLKKFGGIERFVTTLANMLSSDNDVTVVANYGKPQDKLAFSLLKDVKIDFLLSEQPQEISMKKILLEKRFSEIPREIRRRRKIKHEQKKAFKKYLKDINTDVIITERATYNELVGKYYKGKARLIATDHNFHQNKKKYIHELTHSIKKFNYLIVATKELRDFYANKVAAKCVWINHALDKIPEKKSKLNTKNIVAVGRFYPEKDFLTLVDVMDEVYKKDKTVKLFLIGDGPQRKEIEYKIDKVKLKNIVLTGPLDQAQIEEYYYQSSLFVMTSLTEAFGLVLAEAMSYGLPVVAFDRASGARAQVDKEVGVLIKNPDIEKMADKIVELLNNPELIKKYQSTISQKIKKYDQKIIKDDWDKILQ